MSLRQRISLLASVWLQITDTHNGNHGETMKSESKKLAYKLANGCNGETLQDMLASAIKKYPKPKKRLQQLGADGSDVRFIAYAHTNEGMLIGVFHKLTKGKAAQVIEMADERDEWPVKMMSPKANPKDVSEFIEGTLFFGVWKNHVVLHQTTSCRAESFEDYLSWLLSRQSEEQSGAGTPAAILVELTDPLPPEVRKKSKVPVRKVILGGNVKAKLIDPTTKRAKSSVTSTKAFFRPTGKIWEAILAIMSEVSNSIPDDIRLADALGNNDLRASLELSCTKKNSDSSAGQVLTALGSALRNSDSTDYKVQLADNSEITREKMKVQDNFGVECVNKLPVHQSMFKRIVEYMAHLVDNQTIIEKEPFGNVK